MNSNKTNPKLFELLFESKFQSPKWYPHLWLDFTGVLSHLLTFLNGFHGNMGSMHVLFQIIRDGNFAVANPFNS